MLHLPVKIHQDYLLEHHIALKNSLNFTSFRTFGQETPRAKERVQSWINTNRKIKNVFGSTRLDQKKHLKLQSSSIGGVNFCLLFHSWRYFHDFWAWSLTQVGGHEFWKMNSNTWTWAQQMLKKKRCSFPIPFSKRDRNVSTGIRKNLPKGLVKCSCLLPANPFYSSACWEPQKMETCRCGGGGTSLATLPSNSQRLAMTSLCDKGEKLVTRKSSTKNDWNQQ